MLLFQRQHQVVQSFAPLQNQHRSARKTAFLLLHVQRHQRRQLQQSDENEVYEESSYVPAGLTTEEYQNIKDEEEANLKAMHFGTFGPRFQPSDTPDGDWMLMPNLWTHGAVDDDSSRRLAGNVDERILTFIESYSASSSSTSNDDEPPKPLHFLCPLVEEDTFLRYAWEQGHYVSAIGVVPSAVIAMREQFGFEEDEWIKEEPEEDDDSTTTETMIVWTHKSSQRVKLYLLGDIFSDQPEWRETFDVVYDKESMEALEPDLRSKFGQRLKSYMKPNGIVYTEVGYDAIERTSSSSEERKLAIIATVPKSSLMDEDARSGITFQQESSNLIVSKIEQGSPFERSMLQEGMRVIKINHVHVRAIIDGTDAHHLLVQETKEQQATIVAEVSESRLQAMPGYHQDQQEQDTIKEQSIVAVVDRNSLDEKLGIRLDENDGIFCVIGISPKSPFQDTGLREGMEVIRINGIHLTGRDMAFAGNILQGSRRAIVEAKMESSVEEPQFSSETFTEDVVVKQSNDVVFQQDEEVTGEEQQSHTQPMQDKVTQDSTKEHIVFGTDFEYVASLGGLYKAECAPPRLVETAHILNKRVWK